MTNSLNYIKFQNVSHIDSQGPIYASFHRETRVINLKNIYIYIYIYIYISLGDYIILGETFNLLYKLHSVVV